MQAYKWVNYKVVILVIGLISSGAFLPLKADEISNMESEINATSAGISSSNEGSFGFIEGAKDMKEAQPETVEVDKYEYEVVGGHMKAQVSKKQYDKRGRLLAFHSEDKMFGRADIAIKLRPARQPQSVASENGVLPRKLPPKDGLVKRPKSDPKVQSR